MSVDGRTGFDTLLFNGANITENIASRPMAARMRCFTRDVADDHHGSQWRWNASISTRLGGADNIVVNDLTGTGVKQVAIDLPALRAATPATVG